MTDRFHIAFSADRNFSVPLGVAIYSLLTSAKPGRKLALYVLDGGVKESTKKRIRDLQSQYDFTIQYFDLARHCGDLPHTVQYTSAMYYRFLLPELLPQDVEKAFYIDADVIFCEDLEDLFQIDLSNCELAAVADVGSCLLVEPFKSIMDNFYGKLGVPDDGVPYYCSGQYLLNLNKMRINNTQDRLLRAARTTPPELLKCCDQDVLNMVLHHDFATLPARYGALPLHFPLYLNAAESLRKTCPYSRDEIENAIQSPAIIHYATAKPNVFIGPRNELEARFFRAWKQSPWKSEVPYAPLKIRKLPVWAQQAFLFIPQLLRGNLSLLRAYGSIFVRHQSR